MRLYFGLVCCALYDNRSRHHSGLTAVMELREHSRDTVWSARHVVVGPAPRYHAGDVMRRTYGVRQYIRTAGVDRLCKVRGGPSRSAEVTSVETPQALTGRI